MSDAKLDIEELPAAPELNSKQRKHLKGLAHSLAVGVQIGKEDLSSTVIEAIIKDLEHHELVKIKIGQSSGLDKKEASEKIPQLTGSSFVQLIGKTVIVYKANPKLKKEKQIHVPR